MSDNGILRPRDHACVGCACPDCPVCHGRGVFNAEDAAPMPAAIFEPDRYAKHVSRCGATPSGTPTHHDVVEHYRDGVLVGTELIPVWFKGMNHRGHFVYFTHDGQEMWTIEALEPIGSVTR